MVALIQYTCLWHFFEGATHWCLMCEYVVDILWLVTEWFDRKTGWYTVHAKCRCANFYCIFHFQDENCKLEDSRVTLITFKPTVGKAREKGKPTHNQALHDNKRTFETKVHTIHTCQWITWRLNTSRAISSMSERKKKKKKNFQNEMNACI